MSVTPTPEVTATPLVTPTPSITPTPLQPTIVVADQSYWLAGIALVSVVVSLFLVFYFSRRITLQTHLRNTLVEAAVKLQTDKQVRDLWDKAWAGPLSPSNPFPPEAEAIDLKWDLCWTTDQREKARLLYLGDLDTRTYEEYIATTGIDPKHFTQANFEARQRHAKEEYDKRKLGIQEYKKWERKEQEIFNTKNDAIVEAARQDVENKLPKQMDVSILGTGFSFLLEFSTVFVIIFAVIIMGMLGVLEGREIAAILAAIAGYVLGKATGRQSTTVVEKTAETIKSA